MRRILLASVLFCAALCGCGSQSDSDPRVREILSAPVPEGINPVVWRDLTERLAAVVEQQSTVADAALRPSGNGGTDAAATGGRGWDLAPAKSVSIPPTNTASATTLSYDDANGVLNWPYYFSGDYDQNGVVSVSDLTPLAVHLGESVTDANSITGVIDGDNNGEITVADLTPIGVNLGKSVQGYRVYSADSEAPYPATPIAPNGTGTQLAGEVLLAQATGDKATQRLQFSFDPPAPTVQTWYWVRPFDGSDDGTPSTLVMIAPGGNPAPFAALSATPDTGATPLRVQLIASASHDEAPGQIVKYEWDLDGDGIYEYDSGLTSSTDAWFYGSGTYQVRVRVTDDTGLSSFREETIEATAGATWHVQEFETGVYRRDSHLVECNGRPGVFFIRHLGGMWANLYRAALDVTGAQWAADVEIKEPSGSGGNTLEAATIDDKPSYCTADGINQGVVLFAQSNDTLGSSWPEPATANLEHWPLSIAQLAGRVMVVTRETSAPNGPLYFNYALDQSRLTWSEPLEIGIHAADMDFGSVDLRPAVAYRHSLDRLIYVAATDTSGEAWFDPVTIELASIIQGKPSMVEAGNRPGVVYFDATQEQLKFIASSDANGFSWKNPVVLARKAGGIQEAALFADGRIGVVYTTRSGAEHKFIVSNGSDGASWSVPVTIAEGEFVNSRTSFEIISGQPTVVFLTNNLNPQIMYFGAYY